MRRPVKAVDSREAARGFTLIEAMVTIAILVVLMAVVAPSFITFVASQRVKTSSFDVYAALMYARSEAIKTRSDVTVGPSPGNTNWSNGWVVQGASTLRTQDAIKGVIITSSNATLTYRLDGRLNTGDALLTVAAETNPDQAGRRCISVDTTGLPRTRTLRGTATCS